uniref:(northern house mosquito) hypothetical protein n=1 Tax=Culex pipiens TaxID=7175 RepID=A0A8D8FI91_CULPI
MGGLDPLLREEPRPKANHKLARQHRTPVDQTHPVVTTKTNGHQLGVAQVVEYLHPYLVRQLVLLLFWRRSYHRNLQCRTIVQPYEVVVVIQCSFRSGNHPTTYVHGGAPKQLVYLVVQRIDLLLQS